MQIIIHLPKAEATRMIEDEEENFRTARMIIIRKIEDVCTRYQIRYDDIEVKDNP